MPSNALVNPQIIINNIAIPFVPNSAKIDLGTGEQNVKAVAGGGAVVDTVYFNDVENSVSKVEFDMYVTDVTIELHQDWKSLGNGNTIEVVEVNGITATFPFMAHTNRVEFAIGNDKMVTITFMGNPAIT